jgi:hypothetical protein
LGEVAIQMTTTDLVRYDAMCHAIDQATALAMLAHAEHCLNGVSEERLGMVARDVSAFWDEVMEWRP